MACTKICIIVEAFWDSVSEGFLVLVDFEKAYNTITFEQAQVMFQLTALSTGMVSLMTRQLQSHVAFCIQGMVVPKMLWTPRAGIRQGDPFSLAPCVSLASTVIPLLQTIHLGLHVRMYVDDWMIYIGCSPEDAEFLLQETIHALNALGLHTGLRNNTSKSKVLLKGFNRCLGLKLAARLGIWGS